MFVYFGCVFLEILKAQISKANYQDRKHEFLSHGSVFKTRLHWSLRLNVVRYCSSLATAESLQPAA